MSDSGFVIGDPRQEVPEGYETRQIPAPKALRDVNTRIWNEWLPNCTEYRPGGNYDIEMYTAPTEDPLPRPTAKYGYLLLRHKNTPCFSFEAGGYLF